MALASRFPELPVYARGKSTKSNIFPKVYDNKNKKMNYSVNEPIRPYINLKQLEFLLDKKNNKDENIDYHDFYMQNYKKMFEPDENFMIKQKSLLSIGAPKKTPAIGYHDAKKDAENKDEASVSKDSHDIKLHIEKIRHLNYNPEFVDPEAKKNEFIRELRVLLKKFPFERNEIENRQIFSILFAFEEFRDLFPDGTQEKLMERLCAYATLETILEAYTPVFGHFAFYLILKGRVKPMSIPHLNHFNLRLPATTPEPAYPKTLGVGSCFGTIYELKDREITTKMFRVMTQEDECEFLKLSFESFNKISKKLINEQKMEKYNVIKNCKAYNAWPKHTIEELVKVFEWRQFSANTILASEGYRCPFIGFIVKGVCHVLRKVDIKVYNKKKKEDMKKMKQVVIGKINKNESFGEKSVTLNEQMSCTIVTDTSCELGVIPCDAISNLDNITVRLLLQTDNSTFANFNQDELNKKFIEQEKKKEWKEFKNSVVNNVIHKYNIVPGHGRHADC